MITLPNLSERDRTVLTGGRNNDTAAERLWLPDEVTTLRVAIRDVEQRVVFGTVVPYNAPAPVNDHDGRYVETFAPGALTKSLTERGDRISLYRYHTSRSTPPIGRAISWRDGDASLDAEFRLFETAAGEQALEEVKAGALDAFSVGFVALRDGTVWEDDRSARRITSAIFDHVALTHAPVYAGATVVGTRDTTDPDGGPAGPGTGEGREQLAAEGTGTPTSTRTSQDRRVAALRVRGIITPS